MQNDLDLETAIRFRAAELIERDGWLSNRRNFAGSLFNPGGMRWCMMLALSEANRQLTGNYGSPVSPESHWRWICWNDAPERTMQEVTAKLRGGEPL